MKILSREISEQTEKIVAEIETSAHLKIAYHAIKERPNQSDQVAGSVDTSGADGLYHVYLDKRLPQEAFETDVLHELKHILQAENGVSMVYNKPSSAYFSRDRDFIKEVGSHLASVVLDIDVNRWLEQLGYQYSFFARGNLDYLIQNSNFHYKGLADPLNFANLVLALLVTSCSIDEENASRLFDAYRAYPKVVDTTRSLRERLLSMPLDTPTSTCLAHCILVDELELWTFYYVAVGDRKIRSHQEYLAFCMEAGFSLDK